MLSSCDQNHGQERVSSRSCNKASKFAQDFICLQEAPHELS